MTKANFTIIRQCEQCSNMFESQKRTTRFCSDKCNSQNYKMRKRLELKKDLERKPVQTQRLRPKVKAFSLELITGKEYLTVTEVSLLFGCSKDTVYRMIKADQIKATNLSEKLTRIRKRDIESLFETPKKETKDLLKVGECYEMNQIVSKYSISRHTIYNNVSKHNIKRIKQNGTNTQRNTLCETNIKNTGKL